MSVSTCDLQAQINDLNSRVSALENVVEGQATLLNGAVEVLVPSVTPESIVIFSRHTAIGGAGHLFYSVAAGKITFGSTDLTDNSTLVYRVY
jgi:hypothetical protein